MGNSVKRLQYHTRHVSNYLKFFAPQIRFIEKFNGSREREKFRRSETHFRVRSGSFETRAARDRQSFFFLLTVF